MKLSEVIRRPRSEEHGGRVRLDGDDFEIEEQPVFKPGGKYFGIDTSRLPKGSVDFDGVPPGHAEELFYGGIVSGGGSGAASAFCDWLTP